MKSIGYSIKKEHEEFEKKRQSHEKRLKKLEDAQLKRIGKIFIKIGFYKSDIPDEVLEAALLKIMELEKSSMPHRVESAQGRANTNSVNSKAPS